MNGKIFVGQKALSLTEYDKSAPISGVILWVDEENCYEAGDETGTVIEQDCPYASQEMANNLLATLQGYSYQGLEASGAKVSPIAELGDGITVNGLYTQLAYQNIRFSTGEVMDVAAPGSDETLHEYKIEGQTTKQFTHQIAETRSLISKTSEEILLQVESELEGLSSSFTVQLNSIKSQVSGLDDQVSSIEQYVDSITLSVSNGSTSSTIQLKAGSATITSQTIQMSGLVTFTGLSNGTTTINGACIKTGTIDADRLNLTGAITFGDLSSSVQNDINDAYSMAEDAQTTASNAADVVDGWTYRGTTYIDGTRIMTGTVSASTLEGGEIVLLDSRGYEAGTFTLDGSSSTSGRKVVLDSNAIELNAINGDIFLGLYSGQAGYLHLTDNEVIVGLSDLRPNQDDRWYCGTNSNRWSAVYASSPEIVTSDRNKKNSITYDMSPYDALFDRLKPTPYKYNEGTSGRTHLGMISQDVEEALADCGLDSKDFAGFVKGEDEEKNVIYSLRYEEFISLCIYEIQILKARIKDLEVLV